MNKELKSYIFGWCNATFEHLPDEYIEGIDSWSLLDGVDINFFGKEYSGEDGIKVVVYDEDDRSYEFPLFTIVVNRSGKAS